MVTNSRKAMSYLREQFSGPVTLIIEPFPGAKWENPQ